MLYFSTFGRRYISEELSGICQSRTSIESIVCVFKSMEINSVVLPCSSKMEILNMPLPYIWVIYGGFMGEKCT